MQAESSPASAVSPGGLGLWRRRARVARRLALLTTGLALGAPVQALLRRVGPRAATWLPFVFHRYACRVMGVRRDVRGVSRGAVLLGSNHMSWLDIVVLSACRPTAFVARADIAGWPLFGALAWLQDTLFVSRERRQSVDADAREIARRVTAGQGVTLFAEGTTSDGCGVLPFRSALLGAARHGGVVVQSVALAYVARDGGRLDEEGRRAVAWWGEKTLAPHLLDILGARTLDVRVEFGAPGEPQPGDCRKALTRLLEQEVRRKVEAALA